MNTIKINNKIILVSTDVIVDYLKYRKLKNMTYPGVEEDINMYIQNIMMWGKFFDTTFTELEPELEKIANDLI